MRRSYPDASEIRAVWDRCTGRVDEDEGVAAWLRSRRIDPGVVADRDLARALVAGAALPAWAAMGRRSWAESGHRVLMPLWGPGGDLVSLRARWCGLGETKAKAISPRGCAVGGLVLADGFGRQVLELGRPAWWPAGEPLVLWLVEGEPDALTLSTWWSEAAETAPAVWGLVSGLGSWTPEIVARVPDGTDVVIAVDSDEVGEGYALGVARSLAGRCRVRRWRMRRPAEAA